MTLIMEISCVHPGAGPVDHCCRFQHQQPGLFDLNARARNPLADGAVLVKVFAEGFAPCARATIRSRQTSAMPILRMQWWIPARPEPAWAIMKPSPSAPIRLLTGTRTLRNSTSGMPSGSSG